MNNKQIKVLLLEDEAAHAEAIRRALESPENNFELQEAGSLEKYREQVEAKPPDIALLDMMLPDGNSIDLLTAPPEANAFPMIILTSHGNEQAAVAALKAGALDYVVKSPETIADMRRIITRNLNQWSLIQEKSKAEQALRESEINFRNSIENSPLGIRIIGEDGETLYTNRTFLDICGYQNLEEFQNTPVEQRYTPESYTELKERQKKRRRREMLTDNFEVSIIRKDGSIRQLQVMRREILWGGQRRYHSIYQDVTERKHMTQQILELNNILHLISEVNQLIVHADNEVELLQKACSRLVENGRYQIAWIGFKQEGSYDILPSAQCGERIDYLSSAKITWDDSPFGCGPTGAAIKTGKPMVIKDISHHPSYKPWREKALESGLKSSAAFPLCIQDKVIGVLHVYSEAVDAFDEKEISLLSEMAEDMSLGIEKIRQREELLQMDEALKEREAFNRSLFENAPNPILVADGETAITYVNPALEVLTGFKNAELIGKKVPYPWWQPEEGGRHDRADQTPDLINLDINARKKDGELFWYFAKLNRVFENGKVKVFISNWVDVTERKKAEESLKASEEKYRSLVNNIKLGIFRSNPAGRGRFLEVNKAMEDITGYSRQELLGMDVADIYTDPEARRKDVDEVILSMNEVQLEANFKKKDGTIITVSGVRKAIRDDSGSVIVIDGILEDITERRKMEFSKNELERKAQIANRLAAVGEMAAGVAHEINNPLTGVIGFSKLLMEREDLSKEIRDDLRIIADGSQRVAEIVKRLLTFARQAKPVRTSINLNELIDNTLKLRDYVLKTSNIDVYLRLDPDLPWAVVDPGQLQQVFMNLIVNAEQAMKEAHGKGSLIVSTEKKDNSLRISFRDDGSGISQKNMAHLFEPFFTTKEPGEGTGLGLSLSRSIILEHNGELNVESEEGKGATFMIDLPITNSQEPEARTPAPPTRVNPSIKKQGKVLVIDDEPSVRRIIARVLTSAGHTVDETGNPEEVRDKLSNSHYDLLFIDIRMPGMSGMDLYYKVLENSPIMAGKIIFITGDVMGIDVKDFLTQNNLPYLAKPFSVAELKEKVAVMLESSTSEGGSSKKG